MCLEQINVLAFSVKLRNRQYHSHHYQSIHHSMSKIQHLCSICFTIHCCYYYWYWCYRFHVLNFTIEHLRAWHSVIVTTIFITMKEEKAQVVVCFLLHHYSSLCYHHCFCDAFIATSIYASFLCDGVITIIVYVYSSICCSLILSRYDFGYWVTFPLHCTVMKRQFQINFLDC